MTIYPKLIKLHHKHTLTQIRMNLTHLAKIPGVYKQLQFLLTNINILGATIESYINELKYINRVYYIHRFGSYDERKQLAEMLSPPLPSNNSESESSSDDINDHIESLTYMHEIELAELKALHTDLFQSSAITEQRLVDQVIDLTDKVEKMEPDYERYQLIKRFESIYSKLLDLYDQTNAIDLADALQMNPSKAMHILGKDPINTYHSMRKTRNLLAHAMI
jgi:hypothetical protein